MNIETYRQNHRQAQLAAPSYRHCCATCLQPDFACYCPWIKTIDLKIDFVILIHPKEIKRRRITTGRMAHLSLVNSHLIMGHRFEHDPRVNAILADTNRHCVMLYPSRPSVNLTDLSEEGLRNLLPSGKKLTVFVIDGTWSTARKTVNQSPNLNRLPRICFTPPSPSNFRVRLQPRPECYSTIEAIHYTAQLLGPALGRDSTSREHDQLLLVFSKMVERELLFAGARIGSAH